MVIFCEDLTISGNLKTLTVIARLEQSSSRGNLLTTESKLVKFSGNLKNNRHSEQSEESFC
ncbi:MAG: hypothetical protein IJ143_03675 [Neisseriaceae bacterium]|nr:hypothetical protein [Neisseriaceae bacterium]